ncbi:MAG: hypothetical protein HDKAJFGB_02100 [Anaerolineae bacterium]|nr:hypothetical protein [Anaerolineae bacterium]
MSSENIFCFSLAGSLALACEIKFDSPPGNYKILGGWYDARDPAFARLHVFDESGKDVGDFVTLGQEVEVK